MRVKKCFSLVLCVLIQYFVAFKFLGENWSWWCYWCRPGFYGTVELEWRWLADGWGEEPMGLPWSRANDVRADTPCCTAVEFALLALSPAMLRRCTFCSFQRLEPALLGRPILTFDGRLASRTQRILDLDLAAPPLSAAVFFPESRHCELRAGEKKGLMKSICSVAKNKSFSLSQWNSIGLCRWWCYGNSHWHHKLTIFWATYSSI